MEKFWTQIRNQGTSNAPTDFLADQLQNFVSDLLSSVTYANAWIQKKIHCKL